MSIAPIMPWPLLAVLAVTGVLVLSHFQLFTFLTPFLEDEVGVPTRSLGLVFAAFGVAGVLGSLVGGRLAEARPQAVALGAAAVLLASYLVLRLAAPNPVAAVVAVAVWGATFSVVAVSQQLAVLRLAGVSGADSDGIPWVNRLVDAVRADVGLGRGVAEPVFHALATQGVEDVTVLAQKAAAMSPGLRVMFITGFAAVTLKAGGAMPQARVLSKPFHLRDLVMEVDRLFEVARPTAWYEGACARASARLEARFPVGV